MPSAAQHLQLDLVEELDALLHKPDWTNGPNAKTLVKHETLRVVLIALKAHGRIAEHQTEGRISIQTIRGHILVRAAGQRFDLPAGRLLVLDAGLRHDVEALEDSGFLLTIALSGKPERAAS